MAKARDHLPEHPTREEFLGLAEAVSRALGWCREKGIAVDPETCSLHTAKQFIAGGATDAQLCRDAGALIDLGSQYPGALSAHPHARAHTSARDAVRAVVGIARAPRVDAATFRSWRLQVIEKATLVGDVLAVAGATHQLEVAASTAPVALTADAQDPDPVLLRATGEVLAALRERAKLTREDVVVRLHAQGVKLTTAALARIEGGTGRAELPLDALARAVGSSERAVDHAARRAVALAQQMGGTSVGVDVSGPSWYARAEAAFGERYARALLLVATVAALRPEVDGA